MPTREVPCQGKRHERGWAAASLRPAGQPSDFTRADGDAAGICPLEQRDQVLAADAEALADGGRLNVAGASNFTYGLGELVERLGGVISVALDRFDQPATRGKSQCGRNIPAPRLPFELGYARRRQTRALQDPYKALQLRLTPFDFCLEALSPDDPALHRQPAATGRGVDGAVGNPLRYPEPAPQGLERHSPLGRVAPVELL